MRVKFFAYYRDIFKCKEINIKSCKTINELVDYFCYEYGQKVKNIFYKNNKFSDEIIILVNGRHINHLEKLETKLKESDTVSLFPVVAGG